MSFSKVKKPMNKPPLGVASRYVAVKSKRPRLQKTICTKNKGAFAPAPFDDGNLVRML